MSISAQLSHAHRVVVASRHARRLRIPLNLLMVPYDDFAFNRNFPESRHYFGKEIFFLQNFRINFSMMKIWRYSKLYSNIIFLDIYRKSIVSNVSVLRKNCRKYFAEEHNPRTKKKNFYVDVRPFIK